MNSTLTIETYRDTGITFRGDAWVNATQMAKPFGKVPYEFLRLPATKTFIEALKRDEVVIRENPESLFEVVKGNHSDGRAQGTWMHPDLALEFARWLSPEFAIWTNRVIRKIMAGEQPQALPQADLMRLVDSMQQIAGQVSQQTAILAIFEERLSAVEGNHMLPIPKGTVIPRKFRYPETRNEVKTPNLSELDDDYTRAFSGLPTETIRTIFIENGWVNHITGELNPYTIKRGFARYCSPTQYYSSILVTMDGAAYLRDALIFHWERMLSKQRTPFA